jgi:hypothetical protein
MLGMLGNGKKENEPLNYLQSRIFLLSDVADVMVFRFRSCFTF